MSKIINISKSKIEEHGPGDLILAIDSCPYEEKEKRTYPNGLSLLIMVFSKLRDCNEGNDKLRLPDGDILYACIIRRESEEKYQRTG